MTDPWLSAQQRADEQWVQLDAQLQAVIAAAIAETLAKLWRLVLGERVTVTAAAQPPAFDGAEQAARETWIQALTRWVRPIVFAHYARQYLERDDAEAADAPTRARDAWWADTLSRVEETADRLVLAVRASVQDHPTESIDALRDRVARTLGLDAPSAALRDQIADLEARLAAFSPLTAAQRDELLVRRVRLQAEMFRIQASGARSRAYTALAQVLPAQADQFRELARSSSRSAGDMTKVRKELAAIDERLYRSKRPATAEAAAEEADLHERRRRLYRDVEASDETWRNTARRIARTESTNVLNEATLQRGLDAEADVGERLVKVWLSARDERVRPTHRASYSTVDADGTVREHAGAHGQVVGIREKFRVGDGFLDRPGDPNGPLEEVIQCRCSIAVLTESEHTEIAAVLAAATPQEDSVTATVLEQPDLADLPPVMWHGVIAVEGIYTGDGRKFAEGSIRTQALPMPIRFVREDWGGHQGAVVTANMEAGRRYQGFIRAWGTFADGAFTPEVDEVQGLMATRMMRGISIDGDDVLASQFSLETDAEGNLFEVYDSLRLRSSTLVAIPAFDEAEVFLGPPPAEWLLEGEALAEEQNDPETVPFEPEDLDALVADVSRVPEQLAEYWTSGEGAAKIRWGESGDFDRCRRQLSEHVSPGQVSGTCANLHHRATGQWPGQAAGRALTAALEGIKFTADDFAPRELAEPTPITITDDGQVFGHIALWSSCHTGYSDMCVTPPKSRTGYAMFHTGAVRLADGTDLPVGKLTVGAGHANPRAGLRNAAAHYDNSALQAAVVRASEDVHGIQVAGLVIPGTAPETVEELRRSPISGDWRAYQGNLELVAALGVNVPGFAVPRPLVASLEGRQISLVAAGGVPRSIEERVLELTASVGLDPASKAAALAASLPPLTPAELNARVAAQAARITLNEEA